MTKSLKRIHQVKVSLSQEELESLDKIAESMSSNRSTVMRYLLNTYRLRRKQLEETYKENLITNSF